MCIVKAPKAAAKITASAKFNGIGLSRSLPKLANFLTNAKTEAGQYGLLSLYLVNTKTIVLK